MTEQREQAGVPAAFGDAPSRRALVHAAAWAVPAISVAAAAPANAAGSQQPTLTFHPGNSYVAQNADGGWDFYFDHAYVDTGGLGVKANALTMMVTFVPDPGHSADQLSVLAGGPTWWSPRVVSTVSTAYYLYQQASGTGAVSISDGHWFGTAQGSGQVGSFLLTFQMAGFQSATYSLHAPPTHALTFDAGATYARQLTGGLWGIEFQGASLKVRGGDINTRQLIMEVSFVPDPGQSDSSFTGNGLRPNDWSTSPAGTTTDLPFFYDGAVLATTGEVPIPISDGLYFTTHLPAAQQTGSFQLRFYAPGFNQTIYRISVPGSPQLHFDPGTSYAKHTPSNIGGDFDVWGIQFQGASLTVTGGLVPQPAGLKMTVTYVPDPGFTDTRFLFTGNSPAHWPVAPNQRNPLTQVVYAYDQTVDATAQEVALPIADGEYFTTLRPADGQQGHFQVVFSAPGFASATYRVHVPTKQLAFDPGTSFINGVNGFWGVPWTFNFRGAAVTVIGGDIVQPADLTMTVRFVPDEGFPESRVGGYFGTWPTSWPATSQSFPATELVYAYSGTLSATAKDVAVPLSDGSYFYTWGAPDVANGSFLLTFSAPGFAPASFSMRTPRLEFDPGRSFVAKSTTQSPPPWLFSFKGASLKVSGADVAASTLTMTVTFEPDPDAPQTRTLGVKNSGPSGWTQQPLGVTSKAVYYYLSPVSARGAAQTLTIQDGTWFGTAFDDVHQRGDIVITFDAGGLRSDTYRIHVPAP